MRLVQLFVIVGLVTILAGSALADQHESGRFWYVVDNVQKVEEGARIVVWVTLPPVWHGQAVTVSDFTPEPAAILDDPGTGNRIVEWVLEPEAWEMEPVGEPRQFYFHYDLELEEKEVRRPDDSVDPGTYDRSDPDYQRYTKAETWIQVRGPVHDLAERLTAGEDEPAGKARLLFDWMVENMTFVPGALLEQDAESVLTARTGDCGQFSILYTALCRSVGIPARTVANVWAVGGRHTFAEVLLPRGDWLTVDVALARRLSPGYDEFDRQELKRFKQRRGIVGDGPDWMFGNFGSNRVIVSVGNNQTFESPTLGREVILQRMAPGGIFAMPEGSRIEGLNRSIVHGGFFEFGPDARDEDRAHEMAHQHLADLFFRTGVDTPAPTCSKGPEFEDDGIQSWLNAGKVWMHKGEYYKAESAFKRAQQKVDGRQREKLGLRAWIHNYLGNCYDMLDRREMALAEYQAVVELNSNYRGARDYAERYLEKPFVHRIH